MSQKQAQTEKIVEIVDINQGSNDRSVEVLGMSGSKLGIIDESFNSEILESIRVELNEAH
jgi:hypothetical protein